MLKFNLSDILLVFICVVIVFGAVYLNNSKNLYSNSTDNTTDTTTIQDGNETVIVHNNQVDDYVLDKKLNSSEDGKILMVEDGKLIDVECSNSSVEWSASA